MKKTIKPSIECIKREQRVDKAKMVNLQIFTLRQPDNILKNMNTHTVCMYCSVSSKKEFWTGGFLGFLKCTLFNTASSVAP
jgi:hypothetical protein